MSKLSSPSMKSVKSESRKRLSSLKTQAMSNPDSDISIVITGSPPVFQWPEWNDSEINVERWDCKVIVKTNNKKQTTQTVVSSSRSDVLLFEDDPLPLPASWKVHTWRRPTEMFNTDDNVFELYDETHELSIHELVSLNEHVVHSEFIRSFLSAILTVHHLGAHDTFPIEGESTTFISNTKHLPWRPWHHIYSLCKAGRNIQHKPMINPSGKYIVRLYFMGCWRKITVDDKIPVDIDGKVLLPLTSGTHEIWPLLLAKAMLKVASLTWTNDKELVEFNPVYCLTGWIVQERDTNTMNVEDVWGVCNTFAKQFPVTNLNQNTEKEEKQLETVNYDNLQGSQISSTVKSPKLRINKHSTNTIDTSLKTSKTSRVGLNKGISKVKSLQGSKISTVRQSILKHSPGMGSKIRDSSKISTMTKTSNIDSRKETTRNGSSKRKSSDGSHSKTRINTSDEDNLNTGPVLFGLLPEYWPMMNVVPAHFESPLTLGHPFLILQTRDTQFVCQKSRPGVPQWKRYRWIDWASERGIFNPDLLLPFRSLQIVSVFSDWFEKIEEKDNPDVLNTLSVDGIHASGDQGSGDHTHVISLHDHKIEEQSEHNPSQTSRHSTKSKKLSVKHDAGGDMLESSGKQNKSESKNSFLSNSNRTPLSYLDTIQSHVFSQFVTPDRDDEAAVPKCGTAIWTDFNHMWRGIDKMLVFYKPSGFRYKMNIANFALNRETPVLRRNVSGDKKSVVDAVQSVTVPFSIQRSCNDGIYLLFDSVDCIKVLFMLCTVPGDVLQPMKNNSINGVNNDQGDPVNESDAHRYIPRKKAATVNVVIEHYNWASNQFNEILLVMEAFGSKSAALNLGKGRYILRVWIKTNSTFVLSCLSDTAIIAGNRYKIDNVISTESERLIYFSQELRNKLSYMIVTFGKQQFKSALRATFQTINDACTNQNKGYIHDVFMDAIVATVKHFTTERKDFDEYLFALRVLFLNVSLGLEKKVKPIIEEVDTKVFGSFSQGESEEKQVIDYDKYTEGDWITSRAMWSVQPSLESRYQEAAYLIQATWKRYCAMKLMNINHDTRSKEHKLVVERLKTLHETLFRSSTYGDPILKILASMLDLAPDVAKWLPLYNDLGFIVKVETWRGVVVNIYRSMWIPIVRLVVNCHSETPVIGAVNVICQCPKYMMRIIDNDNYIEKPRQVFNTEPCMYSKNVNGYTIFIYAWSEMPQKKQIKWKLEIVTLKNSPYLHSCITLAKEEICSAIVPPALMTLEVSNYYIPNRENLMCRVLIRVKTKMLTSFRLTSSFTGVRFTMCLQDKDGFPLMHAQAEEGAVIIPAAFLEKENKSKDTLYIIEAKVLADSWPLTRQEWIVQERIKNEYSAHKERFVLYKSTSRLSLSTIPNKKLDVLKQQPETKKPTLFAKKRKECVQEFQFEYPFWTLQTVIDYRQRDFIKVHQDNRREEAVKAMKMAWEAADPGRAKRGHELRNEFIREIYGVEHDTMSSTSQIHSREKLFGKMSEVSSLKLNDAREECTERFHHPPSEFAIAHSRGHFNKTITQYSVGADNEPKVKTREDHERELEERRKQDEEYAEKRHRDADEMAHVLVEQQRKHRLMYEHYAKTRHESNLRMQAAYEMRDEFVRKKIEEEEVRKRVEAWMHQGRKKLSSKKTSKKSSRKSSPKKKGKKSTKTFGSSVKSLK